MLVRRLAPQEDKLNIAEVPDADLDPSRATWVRSPAPPIARRLRRGRARVEQSRSGGAAESHTHLGGIARGDYIAYSWLVQGEK